MPLQLLQFLLNQSRRTLVSAVIAGFISGAINAGMLALVNLVISHRAPAASVLFIFFGLCLLAPLARTCSELLLIRLSQNALLTLRTELSRQVIGVALCKLESLGAHRILSALTDDLPRITDMVAVVPVLCINIGVVTSCVVYMGWLHPVLLLEVLGFLLIGTVTYQFGIRYAARHLKAARKHENQLYKHFRSLTLGIKELKLHRRRRNVFVSDVLYEAALSARSENTAGLSIYSASASWGQLLVFLAIGLIVFVLAGVVHASSGVITGFTLALLYTMGPLQMIMNALPGLKRADVAICNVQEVGLALARSSETEEITRQDVSQTRSVRLDASAVTYAYQASDSAEQFLLGPIDLTILPGELLFIAGGNGSGKTTLAKLLVGLYAPDSGEISWNGQPVTDQNRDDYRQLFSAVFSDFMLFDSLLGLECMDLDDRVREQLEQLKLEHKVRIDNGAISTTDLSQGQRKRLALLTACLEDRPVYFLDEWAADQDPIFKHAFYTQILPDLKARGKTVVVISHDDHFYYVADRIIKLESGQIVSEVAQADELLIPALA